MSSKTTQPTELEIAEFNFKAEMERARLLLDIASTADGIATDYRTGQVQNPTAIRVRNAALEQLDRLLHPAMQIVTEPENG